MSEYTSAQIRKKVKVMLGGLGNGVITMPSEASSREVADMLSYAADMRDRCEERISYIEKLDKTKWLRRIKYSQNEVLSMLKYIFRGNAEKDLK